MVFQYPVKCAKYRTYCDNL